LHAVAPARGGPSDTTRLGPGRLGTRPNRWAWCRSGAPRVGRAQRAQIARLECSILVTVNVGDHHDMGTPEPHSGWRHCPEPGSSPAGAGCTSPDTRRKTRKVPNRSTSRNCFASSRAAMERNRQYNLPMSVLRPHRRLDATCRTLHAGLSLTHSLSTKRTRVSPPPPTGIGAEGGGSGKGVERLGISPCLPFFLSLPPRKKKKASTSRAVCPGNAGRAWSGESIVAVGAQRAGRTAWWIRTLRGVRENKIEQRTNID
jgi:hypothetical protein